jgi:DNA-binding response OmpR family regulator
MSKKIWIIDDDPGILEAVTMILEEESYKTKTISDEKALNREIKKEIPQLILLDILLSGIDGRDIARKLKVNPRTKNVPIIMMSADTHIEEKAKEAGAEDFIRKPFDIGDLIGKIETHTNKSI